MEFTFEASDIELQHTHPDVPAELIALQREIVSRFARCLQAGHLGLASARYQEFIGNQEAIGRQLADRLLRGEWTEVDSNPDALLAGYTLPKFRSAVPLAFGYELGGLIHAQLYPDVGRRDAVAEVCALFNLLISVFDWVIDRQPRARNELQNIFFEDTLKSLTASTAGVLNLQRTAAAARNTAVSALLKVICNFFTYLHTAIRVSTTSQDWARLHDLLLRAYRAEIVTTGLCRQQQGLSEALRAAYDKSVLPFEIFFTLAIACEDQPLAAKRDDAVTFVQTIGTLMAVADEVSDLARDYRSGDANTILLRFGIGGRNHENDGPENLDKEFNLDVGECAKAVVAHLYEKLARALSCAMSAANPSGAHHVQNVLMGYAQGWLGMTQLEQYFSYDESDIKALRRVFLTDGLKIAQGIRRDGAPCNWFIDGRATMLRSNTLQIATRQLWQKIRHYRPTAVGGVSLGADPVVAGLMLQAESEGWGLKGFMIRQEPKGYGLCRQVEGPELDSQDRVALVDDLIGGGNTLLLAAKCIEPFQPKVVVAGGVLDLCKGGAANLREQGIPVETVLTSRELGLAVQHPLRPDTWQLLWCLEGIYRSVYWAPKASPTFAHGLIYLGSDAGYVACLTGAGERCWQYAVRDTLRGVHAKPLISDGKVYFGSYDGFVYCLDALSGRLEWETHCAAWILSSLSSGSAGNEVYVSGGGNGGTGVIAALSAATGKIIWRLETESPIESSPSLDANRNRLVIGSDNCEVYGIDTLSGKEVWRFSTEGAVKGAAAIDNCGRCIVGSYDGFLYALDSEWGTPIWKRKISNGLHTQPLLCDDMVISAGHSKHVVALKTGSAEVCWIATLRGPHTGGAALVAEKWIAIGCDAGTAYLLDRERGVPIWTYDTGGSIRATPAAWGDQMLVPSTDGRLYCFGRNTI